MKIFQNLFDLSEIVDSLNDLELNESVQNKLNLNFTDNVTLHNVDSLSESKISNCVNDSVVEDVDSNAKNIFSVEPDVTLSNFYKALYILICYTKFQSKFNKTML